jgi:hypothetical protein
MRTEGAAKFVDKTLAALVDAVDPPARRARLRSIRGLEIADFVARRPPHARSIALVSRDEVR